MAVIKNSSQAYGYKYTSLADIANAGIKIPKMRTKVTDNGEYVEYLDEDNTWQQGARIVPITMHGQNEAQAYGASLTYARRYTVQLAMSVVCDDDKNVETQEPVRANSKKSSGVDIDYIKTTLKTLKTNDEVDKFAVAVNKKYPNITDKQKALLGAIFSEAREELE